MILSQSVTIYLPQQAKTDRNLSQSLKAASVELTSNQPILPLEAPRAKAEATIGPDAALRKTAQEFEAVFLAEMLKHTGINTAPEGFDGGYGEDAFSSLITEEYARILAGSGGIGLAEQIFESLKERTTEE